MTGLDIKTRNKILHNVFNIPMKTISILIPSIEWDKIKGKKWVSIKSMLKEFSRIDNLCVKCYNKPKCIKRKARLELIDSFKKKFIIRKNEIHK